MYVPAGFIVEEFVDPKTYAKQGDKSILKMDIRMLRLAEWLRKKTGTPITINDWKWGGQYQWSALRTGESGYSNYSAHMVGMGIDFKSKSHSPSELQQLVIDNWEEVKEYTGLNGLRMEHTDATPTWCHMDSFQDDGKIYIFRP